MTWEAPPERSDLTIGGQVESAFRLFDVLPFMVRHDLARLIFLYLHDPAGYMERRASILASTAPLRSTRPPGNGDSVG